MSKLVHHFLPINFISERAAAVETAEKFAALVADFFGKAAPPVGAKAPGVGNRDQRVKLPHRRRQAEAISAEKDGAREGGEGGTD